MPLFFVISARGLERAVALWGRRAEYLVLSLVLLECAVVAYSFPWGQDAGAFSAMNYVGLQRDSNAVAYDMKWFASGAYTFLHKQIPAVEIADEMVSPTLQFVSCGRPDFGFVGFQCSPAGSVLESRWIDYVIVSKDDRSLAERVESSGFRLVKDFDGVSVYSRY